MKRDAVQQLGAVPSNDPHVRHHAAANSASFTPYIRWALLALLLAGVALRLWLIDVSTLDPRFSSADDGDYYRRALRFAVTGQYIDDSWLIRPPLHVFFFALWLRLALVLGQAQLGILFVQLAQTFVAALTVLAGYGIARRLFDSKPAGLLFAAFLALWFPFVEQASVLFSELLYMFWLLLHVWLLLRFDTSNRPRDLALSGVALGAASLTRPAIYSLAFVVLWLVVRAWSRSRRAAGGQRRAIGLSGWPSVARQSLLVVICCLAVVAPWTARNYVVYQRFIPVDTLGPINFWIHLDKGDRRNQRTEELRRLPQGERQAYAMARIREILAEDPLRPFDTMWPTFRHIWKAQYVEDFFANNSFYTRPLRAAAPLGLAGDVIWIVYTIGGLVGLAAPPREGWHNRLFVLAWIGFSLMNVLLLHVEPRYLLPLWALIGLYASWTLANVRSSLAVLRARPLNGALAAALVAAFVALVVTYRDYPAIIARGLARERAIVAAERAYATNDYPAAERGYRAALAAQPNFVDGQIGLALALAGQGRHEEAIALLETIDSRRAGLVQGVLTRDDEKLAAARGTMSDLEGMAGEDLQPWALQWLRPAQTTTLELGTGHDLGYIAGFSGAEQAPDGGFRWLQGAGQIVLPLPEPLRPGASLVLRMTGGPTGDTPLDVRIGDRWIRGLTVQTGQWRAYRLPVPEELVGQQRLAVELRAPTFVPALVHESSDDARPLSLMISDVRVQ